MKRIAQKELTLPLGMKHISVVGVEQTDKSMLVVLRKTLEFGVCPSCGAVSQTIKDRHIHEVVDRPIFENGTKLQVVKRRWKCLNDFCEINTFTEEIEGLSRKRTHTPGTGRRLCGLEIRGRRTVWRELTADERTCRDP